VAHSNLRNVASHETDVARLFAHERVPQNDLLAAQVARATARQSVIRAQSDLDVARAAYNRLVGRPLEEDVTLDELPLTAPDATLQTLTSSALRARPELAALASRAEAARHDAASARARGGPQLELQGTYTFQENRFESPEGIAAVGVAVHWNLYDGEAHYHQAQAHLHGADRTQRLLADLESIVALDVRSAWIEMREARQRVEVTREAIGQAEENLRVARRRYATGASTNTEVLDAESLRAQTNRNYYFAIYDGVSATLRVRYAAGDL
jgi:outer membrane protein TolC